MIYIIIFCILIIYCLLSGQYIYKNPYKTYISMLFITICMYVLYYCIHFVHKRRNKLKYNYANVVG